MEQLLKLTNILLTQHEWVMSLRRKVHLIEKIIETKDVPGSIVEIGCYEGLNSILIQTTLDLCESDKSLHLYDSFEGLPECTEEDISFAIPRFYPVGKFKAKLEDVKENFELYELKEPVIHVGRIEKISANDFPQTISLAFLDLDFYKGTLDALDRVWPLMSVGGIIILDDFGFKDLPGVQKAAYEFFEGKAEVEFTQQCEITGIIRKQ